MRVEETKATDIKLTPYLSKMPTDGESVNAKKRTKLKTKFNNYQTFTLTKSLPYFNTQNLTTTKKPAVLSIIENEHTASS